MRLSRGGDVCGGGGGGGVGVGGREVNVLHLVNLPRWRLPVNQGTSI